jgi:hypothetical protein
MLKVVGSVGYDVSCRRAGDRGRTGDVQLGNPIDGEE